MAALLLGLAACGDTKVVQCNSVTAIANTANQAAKPAANGDPKTMLAAAESFDSAAQQLNELRLSDRDLRELRDRLASLYSNTSQSTREFLTAVNQKDRGLAEVSLQALEQSAAEEVTLNQAVNDYCVEATTTAFQSSPPSRTCPGKTSVDPGPKHDKIPLAWAAGWMGTCRRRRSHRRAGQLHGRTAPQ